MKKSKSVLDYFNEKYGKDMIQSSNDIDYYSAMNLVCFAEEYHENNKLFIQKIPKMIKNLIWDVKVYFNDIRKEAE